MSRRPRTISPAERSARLSLNHHIIPANSGTQGDEEVGAPALERVLAWWDAEGRDLPWRISRDPYAIWVAEVMAAQTNVGRAAAAWERWIERWPDIEALAAASLPEILREWDGLGYPRRARDLLRSARILARTGWPAELTDLPGVGAYTAAAIRCFAWEEPVLPVDVNVRRVLARRFPDGIDVAADPWRTGQAVMEFGQRICAARPRCDACPVREGCPFAGGRAARRAPAIADPAPRARPQARYEGSLRQRRGELLRATLAAGPEGFSTSDAQAAASLAADGLVELDGSVVRPVRTA